MGKNKAKSKHGASAKVTAFRASGGATNFSKKQKGGIGKPQQQTKQQQWKQQHQKQPKKKNKHRPREEAAEADKAEAGAEAGAGAAPSGRARCPYVPDQRTLLLGEGDFSFGAALSLLWGDAAHLVATSFDNEAAATAKYAALADNVATIRAAGGSVLFGIDATRLDSGPGAKAVRKAAGPGFDRIVFNFPHAGTGQKELARNVASNQALLRGTFLSVQPRLAPPPPWAQTGAAGGSKGGGGKGGGGQSGGGGGGGELHVTIKRGQPYDSWQVVPVAKMCGLRVLKCSAFEASAYPGYAHRRTIGDAHAASLVEGQPAELNAEIGSASKTYVFVPK